MWRSYGRWQKTLFRLQCSRWHPIGQYGVAEQYTKPFKSSQIKLFQFDQDFSCYLLHSRLSFLYKFFILSPWQLQQQWQQAPSQVSIDPCRFGNCQKSFWNLEWRRQQPSGFNRVLPRFQQVQSVPSLFLMPSVSNEEEKEEDKNSATSSANDIRKI